MPPKKEKIEWTYRGQTVNKIEQFPEGSIGIIYPHRKPFLTVRNIMDVKLAEH